MSNTKEEKGKGTSKHFRWSKPMSHTLIKVLAEEAANGNRPSSTFKPQSLKRAAKEISEKFGVDCHVDHVENHLRTVKKEWTTIATLRSKSGFGWDDNLKMVTANQNVYEDEVMANPNSERYLNKKIEMYSEMALVVGKDVATGSYAKSFVDVDKESIVGSSLKDDDDAEDEDETIGKATSSSSKRSHKKRGRDSEDFSSRTNALATEMHLVGQALFNLAKDQLVVKDLYNEVMKTEGYTEEVLGSVFDYLVEHEMQAKGFMAKSVNLRKIWVDKFVKQGSGSI